MYQYVESGNAPEAIPERTRRQLHAVTTHYVSWSRLEWLRAESGIRFLVIMGGKDELMNSANGVLLASALDAPLLFREDAGHGIGEQYADDVNRAIQRIIDEAEAIKVKKRVTTGMPPGYHPWQVALACLAACAVVGGRAKWMAALSSLTLMRVWFGPVWKREREVRLC